MMLDLLVTGYVSVDYIFRVSRSPQVDETSIIERLSDTDACWGDDHGMGGNYGGCGVNVAVALAKLGYKTAVAVVFGDDPAGHAYHAYLEQCRVDTRDAMILPGECTGRSYLFFNPQGGSQLYFYPGAPAAWREPLVLHNLSQTSYCLVTVGDPRYNQAFVNAARSTNLPLIWQMKADIQAYPIDQLRELVQAGRILFMNRTEADYLMTVLDLRSIEEILSYECQAVILTLGLEGSRVYSNKGMVNIPTVNANEFNDPTGAGDGYASGFLAGWLKGWNAEICGRLGATLASFVVEKTGCQTNLPDWETLCTRYETFFQERLPVERNDK